MQFVKEGPDIPERLLQAHEEGRVVFFCGAGISYPAKLPGFKGLVEMLYGDLGEPPTSIERSAIKSGQFDTTIGLLEARIVGGREKVRNSIAGILCPDLKAPGAKTTHEALLTLARCRSGHTRLITTNFDRLFEEVLVSRADRLTRFEAPLLPVPKSRWDGLVYLHGLLTRTLSKGELDRLVLSSGDFGLAYLTERWAARFVSELFRNYTVCFVGYSINDPVLRYMMDALAADRLLGESPPEMFAFGSHSKGHEKKAADEWLAKNVTPILYREHRRHAHLHKTLVGWSETYRDGVGGRERIVVDHALAKPQASTVQDDFVGRMLWALSDASGLPAKQFADHDPVPALDWLEPLTERRFLHSDLPRFGVPPLARQDRDLCFSLMGRPAPYPLAPWMVLVDGGSYGSSWDDVMSHLARWLTRHLGDPKLILWLAKRGGNLHERLAQVIEIRIDYLLKLERLGDTEKTDQICRGAPRAIPSSHMRTLWRLLLTGRAHTQHPRLGLYSWFVRLNRDGLTPSLRINLREILTPRVKMREPFARESVGDLPESLDDLVEWEVVLSTDYVHSALRDGTPPPIWKEILPELFADFASLLRDALDLMAELGKASALSDRSYRHLPSISDHPQNRHNRDWTALVELTRDAWLALSLKSPDLGRLAAESWHLTPYPLFRRLALFAAAQDEVIPPAQGLKWLLAGDGRWLWSIETSREALRLLVVLGARLEPSDLVVLESKILQGPSSTGDPAMEVRNRSVDREIWLRLAKLASSGVLLSEAGSTMLDALHTSYPKWRLAPDQRDEFSTWSGDGEEWRTFTNTPRRRRELMEWIKQHPNEDAWAEDDWGQRCREDFSTCAAALMGLANEGVWPEERWRQALQAWSEESLLSRSWRYMAPLVSRVPNELLKAIDHSASWWVKVQAKSFDTHKGSFFDLCQRLLALDADSEDGEDSGDPATSAINDPIGHVTQALLNWWLRRELEDGEGLPSEIREILIELCDPTVVRFRHGRVLLATHAITLYRVDSPWASDYLIPLFDWQRSLGDARSAWAGFLWSPRLYRPLLTAIKPYLLETAFHFAALGETNGEQYASFMTYVALDRGDTLSLDDLRGVFRALPDEGLTHVAQALSRALEGAGEQREVHWDNRVAPFWRGIWPKSSNLASPAISEHLMHMCVAAGQRFPDAVDAVTGWLMPIPHPGYVIHVLNQSGLCTQFPGHALLLLDAAIEDQWSSTTLGPCLDEIEGADPQLAMDPRHIRLRMHWRRHTS